MSWFWNGFGAVLKGLLFTAGVVTAVSVVAIFAIWLLPPMAFGDTGGVGWAFYTRRELRAGEPHRGQLACFDGALATAPEVVRSGLRAGWLHKSWVSRFFARRVEGTSGAHVTYGPEGVSIDGRPVAHSVALQQTTSGDPLPTPTYPITVAEGFVWLATPDAAGFDSRYFGPVSRGAITCIAEPLWGGAARRPQ